MARQARIKITAETADFRKDIEKVKASIRAIGSEKIDPKSTAFISKRISEDLKKAEEQVQSRINRIKKSIESMPESELIDSAKVDLALKLLDKYIRKLKEIETTQKSLEKKSGLSAIFDKMENFSPFGSKAGRGVNMIAGAAGAIGLTVGVGSLFQRQRGISQERNAIAPFVGGAVTEERSNLGFTSEERRQRLLEIARASGKDLSIEEQNKGLGLGESAERAYGISAQEQGNFMGTARRAGVQDQQKAFAQTIGIATAAGLKNSVIGEFLATMSDGISQLAQGVNIDNSSLQGFAGVLASMPNFQNDPSKILEAAKGFNSSFSGNDRFQQAQASRALLSLVPGASPAAVEVRRQMQLFGSLGRENEKPEERKARMEFYSNKKYGGSPELAQMLSLSGSDIVSKEIEQMFQTLGIDKEKGSPAELGAVLNEIMQRFSLNPLGADAVLRDYVSGGGKISKKSMDEIRKSNMNPEDKIKSTFDTFDGRVTKTGAKIEYAMDKMAKDISGVVVKFDESLNISSDNLATFGKTAVAATAALTALTAVSIAGSLGNGGLEMGKTIGKGAMKAGNTIGKGAMGAGKLLGKGAMGAGKMLGKNAGKLVPGLGIALAAKDVYDVIEKYQNGEEITAKDLAVMSTSVGAGVAGLFPGPGTLISGALSAASFGAEKFLPDGTPVPNSTDTQFSPRTSSLSPDAAISTGITRPSSFGTEFLNSTPVPRSPGTQFSPERDFASRYAIPPYYAPTPPPTPKTNTNDPENTSAVGDNTEAIKRLTDILRSLNSTSSSSSMSSRYPSFAEILNGSTKAGVGY